MNPNLYSYLAKDTNFFNFVCEIVTSQLESLYYNLMNSQAQSFIKIRDRQIHEAEVRSPSIQQPIWKSASASSWLDCHSEIKIFCSWESSHSRDETSQEAIQTGEISVYQNYETYKDLKRMAVQTNSEITKEQIYEELLKPFRHEKVKQWDDSLGRFKISYICRYEGWDKEFTKTWNLLDHVRMHEGIKPFACTLWGKTFTQKGNLKKHNIVQHSTESLEERKKFRCDICDKRYTERYNLVVSINFKVNRNLDPYLNQILSNFFKEIKQLILTYKCRHIWTNMRQPEEKINWK